MNSQYFSKEQIENGELKKLLDFLMESSYGKSEDYNDIHIYPADLGAFIVEWDQVPWNHEYGGRFEYVDEDQRVVREYRLPDDTYVEFETDKDFNDYLFDWLKDNPGWTKTSYGTWTNEIENKKFKDDLEKTNQVQVKEPALTGLDENGVPQ